MIANGQKWHINQTSGYGEKYDTNDIITVIVNLKKKNKCSLEFKKNGKNFYLNLY
jgi:hypothetical protein